MTTSPSGIVSGPLAAAIAGRIHSLPLEATMKGLPRAPAGATVGDIGSLGWGVADLPAPAAVLRRSALRHNAALMADYCARHGVSLAPHGKTTMAPQIVDMQLAQGAWGVTAGSAAQARVFAEFGVGRILVAHQVLDPPGVAELAALPAAHPDLDLIVIVDSVAGVAMMDEALAASAAPRPIGALVELGVAAARTGSRSVGAMLEVAAAVDGASHLVLRGVEGYEGVVDPSAVPLPLAAVDAFLDDMVEGMERLLASGLLDAGADPVLSAGGSVYFDRVVERFAAAPPGVRAVLRSGCYITQDHGKYHRLSPLDGRSTGGPRLRPALEVWACAVSTPEAGRVVLNAGRRDLSFDAGMPVVIEVRRRGEAAAEEAAAGFEVVKLMDQHAIVATDGSFDLRAGDMVALGVSHPCTTFDKWHIIPVADDDDRVVDAVVTYF